MVAKVNQVRASHGLPPVRASRSLNRSSGRYARKLMARDVMQHARRIQASSRFQRLGEVIGIHRGWRARRSRMLRGWLRSPGHRFVLLNPSLRYIGVGKARGRFGRRLATIWVVQMGAR
jgi:uncharacterized protein YkwD